MAEVNETAEILRGLAEDPKALYAAHIALEDELVMMRDSRMWLGMPANGLVIRERDGSESDIIRIGTREAVRRALVAIADFLERDNDNNSKNA